MSDGRRSAASTMDRDSIFCEDHRAVNQPPTATQVDPVLENVRLAVACGADPAMALAVALASSKASTPAEAFAMLDARRAELEKILTEPGNLKTPASLEPTLCFAASSSSRRSWGSVAFCRPLLSQSPESS
jgi:hypothetical protein